MLTVTYAECHKYAPYAECHYAECRYVECRYAECSGAILLTDKPKYRFSAIPFHFDFFEVNRS